MYLAPPVPQMAQPHLLGQERIDPGSFHAPIRQPPNAKQVGRWRWEMSPIDRRLFQRIGGELLAELGYEVPDLGPMPARERLRYAALGAKYVTLQAGRRVLQALDLMPPI